MVVNAINLIPGVSLSNPLGPCSTISNQINFLVNTFSQLYKYFTSIGLPTLTYPDCELCDCKEGQAAAPNQPPPTPPSQILTIPQTFVTNVLSQYPITANYSTSIGVTVNGVTNSNAISLMMSGPNYNPSQP